MNEKVRTHEVLFGVFQVWILFGSFLPMRLHQDPCYRPYLDDAYMVVLTCTVRPGHFVGYLSASPSVAA